MREPSRLFVHKGNAVTYVHIYSLTHHFFLPLPLPLPLSPLSSLSSLSLLSLLFLLFLLSHCVLLDFAYDNQGTILVAPGYPVYECNTLCKCDENCRNRVVQKGSKYAVEVRERERGRVERGVWTSGEGECDEENWLCRSDHNMMVVSGQEVRSQKKRMEGER